MENLKTLQSGFCAWGRTKVYRIDWAQVKLLPSLLSTVGVQLVSNIKLWLLTFGWQSKYCSNSLTLNLKKISIFQSQASPNSFQTKILISTTATPSPSRYLQEHVMRSYIAFTSAGVCCFFTELLCAIGKCHYMWLEHNVRACFHWRASAWFSGVSTGPYTVPTLTILVPASLGFQMC